jgi:hypothetical protein
LSDVNIEESITPSAQSPVVLLGKHALPLDPSDGAASTTRAPTPAVNGDDIEVPDLTE